MLEAARWRRAVSALADRPYTLATGLLFLALSAPFLSRHESEFIEVYVRAAHRLTRGGYLFQEGYLYPPFMAWAALPFSWLPHFACRVIWLAVNLACLVVVVRGSWRLAGGGRLEPPARAPRREHVAAVLGLGCAASGLHNCLAHQQTDLAIASVLVLGCCLAARARPYSAAVCLGLAAACKCTPLLWVPYLVWRRQPLAALLVTVVALGVNLAPDLVSRPADGTWVGEYYHSRLLPLTRNSCPPGKWGSDMVYNQSLAGLMNRVATHTWHWGPGECSVEPRLDPVGAATLRLLVCSGDACLLLAALCAAGRPSRGAASETATVVPWPALEAGMVLSLMLLLSPMSSIAHFSLTVVPAMCLARAALTSRDWRLLAMLTAALALNALPNKDLVGDRLYTLALFYGASTWQAVLLLAGCGVAVRRGTAPSPTIDTLATPPLRRAA